MAKITRVLQKIFGSTAALGEMSKFGSLAAGTPETTSDPLQMQSYNQFLGGWFSAVLGNNSPAIQDVNSLFHLAFRQLAYILQNGCPEYDATTSYYKGSFASTNDGDIYYSLTDDNLGNALSNVTHWRPMYLKSAYATKGDLLLSDGFKPQNLGVGANGSFLMTDSAQSLGAKWVPGYVLGSRQIFTASGTWTRPSGCRAIFVECLGGGAGGGGSYTTTAGQTSPTSGGGAGTYCEKLITAPSASETVTVGAGGGGGAIATIGSNGGTSSFGAILSAPGGGGGNTAAPSTGVRNVNPDANNYVATGGDINQSGQPGSSGFSSPTPCVSGQGGSTKYGGGGRMLASSSTALAGAVAMAYGAGGGGAVNAATGTGTVGGSGASGIIIVWEYY
jgi:hypothetical protein